MIAAKPAPIKVKNSAPTHGGDCFGLGFGGGCRLWRLERLFGMDSNDRARPDAPPEVSPPQPGY
ncbi:MAG: hypothetical protein QOH48_2469 [Actinomycetota bacterium]|nr:hypothetical protein [Actinomycetota bacterium]